MDAGILIIGTVLYSLAFLAAVVVLYCWGDTESPNGCLTKTLLVFEYIVKFLVPRRMQQCVNDATHYVLYTRNTCIQYLYATLMTAGFTAYTMTAFRYVSKTFWGQFPFYALLLNLVFFVLCSCKDPGVIDASNHSRYLKQYEFDGAMYMPRDCSTCNRKKPARSKHCAICNLCVARFDHHCSWVNNCIGKRNYKYFIGFLFSLVAMTGESAFIILMVFLHISSKKNLHVSRFVDDYGQLYESSVMTVTQYLCSEYPLMAFLFVFLLMLFLVLGGFFLFHCYLLLTNQTTNELVAKRKQPRTCSEDTQSRHNSKYGQVGSGKRSNAKNVNSTNRNVKPKSYIFGWYSKGLIANVVEVLSG